MAQRGLRGLYMEANELGLYSNGAVMTMENPQSTDLPSCTVLTVANAFLFKKEPVPELMAAWYTLGALRCVLGMHEGGVLHCDVKR